MKDSVEQKLNFQSRLETLAELWKRYLERLHALPAYDAVIFSSPMCDRLLLDIGMLDDPEFISLFNDQLKKMNPEMLEFFKSTKTNDNNRN